MEYVILAVLIAAGAVVAVVTFSRSVVTSMEAASEAATGEHTTAQKDFDMRKADRAKDAKNARKYHEDMHQ